MGQQGGREPVGPLQISVFPFGRHSYVTRDAPPASEIHTSPTKHAESSGVDNEMNEVRPAIRRAELGAEGFVSKLPFGQTPLLFYTKLLDDADRRRTFPCCARLCLDLPRARHRVAQKCS